MSCGAAFEDEAMSKPIADLDTWKVIDATGHKTEVQGAKEATCTAEGYTGDKVCTVCHVTVEKGRTIAKLPHDYHNGVCANCGAKDPGYVEPSEKPEPSTEPTAKPTTEPTQAPQESQKPEATDKPQTTENPDQVPPTGDSASLLLSTMMLLGTGVCLVLAGTAAVRKRSQK